MDIRLVVLNMQWDVSTTAIDTLGRVGTALADPIRQRIQLPLLAGPGDPGDLLAEIVGVMFLVVVVARSLVQRRATGDADIRTGSLLATPGSIEWLAVCALVLALATAIAAPAAELAGLALLVVAVPLQDRHVEEPYVTALHGTRYRDDTASVGRFLPRLGRSQ
jgi:protein-S-isoprenylcysteine O-methyltransferase Ste14